MLLNKKLTFFLSILLIGLSFESCNIDSKDFFAKGDVVFLKKIINNQEVFAASYYAYGSDKLGSASVTTPQASTTELEPYTTDNYYYYWEPESYDFSATYPTQGLYSFSVTNSEGETLVVSDDQYFDNVGFAEIYSMNYYDSIDKYFIGWNMVTHADLYVVSLFNTANDLIYTSYTIDSNSPTLELTYGSYGAWAESPVEGERYIIQIQSIVYDPNATDDDYSYNVQEISYSETEFVWGNELE